jgi:LL-diaminopimelate aminotransferase
MSEAVQHAAAVALTVEREFPREISEVYARRRDLLARGLREVGLDVNVPRATPYFWIAVPEGHTSASFTELMLEQASVLVSPGDSYGPSGAGYVRLSLTVPDSRLEEAVDRITRALVIIQS